MCGHLTSKSDVRYVSHEDRPATALATVAIANIAIIKDMTVGIYERTFNAGTLFCLPSNKQNPHQSPGEGLINRETSVSVLQ